MHILQNHFSNTGTTAIYSWSLQLTQGTNGHRMLSISQLLHGDMSSIFDRFRVTLHATHFVHNNNIYSNAKNGLSQHRVHRQVHRDKPEPKPCRAVGLIDFSVVLVR